MTRITGAFRSGATSSARLGCSIPRRSPPIKSRLPGMRCPVGYAHGSRRRRTAPSDEDFGGTGPDLARELLTRLLLSASCRNAGPGRGMGASGGSGCHPGRMLVA